jgi:hypothetical protein
MPAKNNNLPNRLEKYCAVFLITAITALVSVGCSKDKSRSGNFMNSISTAKFLLLNFKTQAPGGKDQPFVETDQTTQAGTRYDLYEPKAKVKKTVVVVTGLTLLGAKDPRVVNFCRSLAQANIRAAAIDPAGLKAARFKEQDYDALKDLVKSLAAQYGGKVGIIAFSVGGGMALVAAADSEVSSLIDPVIVFSTYYNLGELLDSIGKKCSTPPAAAAPEIAWDDYIWFLMIAAYRDPVGAGLEESQKKELKEILERYCYLPIDRKRDFYERALKGKSGRGFGDTEADSAIYQKLSPAGKLGSVRARVIIFHDENDTMISADHSRKIFAELNKKRPGGEQKLLVTPLLSHVDARATWRVLDFFRICGMMGEIYK